MVSRITLKELARRLNLDPSTVSRALQGHPDISEVTRKKVAELAARLGYRPDALASGLRHRRFNFLAFVLPEVTGYFYASVLHGVLEAARAHGYKVMVFESREDCRREAEICRLLQKSGVDGMLLIPVCILQETAHLEELNTLGLPLVLVDRLAGGVQADRVLSDDYNSACAVVRHLIRQGCRKIAHLSMPQTWLWAQKRRNGYMNALVREGLPFREEWIAEFTKPAEVDSLVGKLVERYDIDGLFAVNDESAFRAIAVFRQMGLEVPGDIAVAGFGNSPFAAMSFPPLTTVERYGDQMGKVAVELLLDRINREPFETRVRLLKNELIVRDSSRRG